MRTKQTTKPTKNVKVKNVSSLQEIKKLNLKPVLVKDFNKVNVDLYRYFKSKHDNTTFKKTYILYRDFKIWYDKEGLHIIDYVHYSKVVAHPFQDKVPTPESVFKFISSKTGVDKLAIKKEKEKKAEKVNLLFQRVNDLLKSGSNRPTDKTILSLYRQFVEDKSIAKDVKKSTEKRLFERFSFLIPKEEIDMDKLRKRAEDILNNDTLKDVLEKMHRFIPNKAFQVYYGKLYRKYKEREISGRSFRESVLELIQADSVFEPKRKAPKKFIPKPFFEVSELISHNETTVTFKNKFGTVIMSKSKFLAYFILHENPAVHTGIAKFLAGEMTEKQLIKAEFLVRDRFTVLDYTQLEGENNSKLVPLLEEMIFTFALYNPLDILYKNQCNYVLGDKLKVIWPCYATWYLATVTRTENGVQVRYPDGMVDKLYNFQRISKVKEGDLL